MNDPGYGEPSAWMQDLSFPASTEAITTYADSKAVFQGVIYDNWRTGRQTAVKRYANG